MAAALGLLLLGAAERPNLQGKWILNENLTASLSARDREQGEIPGALEGSIPGSATRRPPLGGGPGPVEGPPIGGPTAGDDPLGPPVPATEGRAPKAPPFSLTAFNELTIHQTDGEITITDKEGKTRVLKPDGSKVRDEKAPGGPTDVRASWQKDGTLLVKVRSQNGPDVTESYVISNDRKHLYLTLVLEGDVLHRGFKVRRAYDPAK
jgi:hypothetical protein